MAGSIREMSSEMGDNHGRGSIKDNFNYIYHITMSWIFSLCTDITTKDNLADSSRLVLVRY